MKMNSTSLLFFLLLFPFINAAQDFIEADETKEKKKFSFNLQLNYAKQPLKYYADYEYSGESYNTDSLKWEWIEKTDVVFDKSAENLNTGVKYNHVSLQATIGDLIKNAHIGLNYNFNILSYQTEIDSIFDFYGNYIGSSSSRKDNFYFSLAGVVAYEYEIPYVKDLYVIPTFSIGTYQTKEGAFAGKGLELFTDYRLDLMYKINGKIGVGVFAGFSNFNRNFREQSQILDREQSIKSKMNLYKIGFVASYKWDLIPD